MPSKVTMYSDISIGDYSFWRKANGVEINSSWKNLVDTATIKLPNMKRLLQDKKLKTGDPVVILLGYDGNLKEEFTGYVSEISPKIPLEIKCEDEMWKLKQESVTKSWASVTLKGVFDFLYSNNNLLVPDATLTNFRLNNVSKAKALEYLKDKFGLAIYFRGKVLYAGFPYFETGLAQVNYEFRKNAIADNLVFKRADEVKIKLTAISVLKNASDITIHVGDDFGEQRTMHFYNLTKEELTVQAKNKISLLKYDGYRGSFKAFGIPVVKHGQVANIKDPIYPERSNSVFVDSVKIEYGPETGFRRTIEPGRRAG